MHLLRDNSKLCTKSPLSPFSRAKFVDRFPLERHQKKNPPPNGKTGDSVLMPVPETTSAEAFARYVSGKCLRIGSGDAWRDIKAWTIAL